VAALHSLSPQVTVESHQAMSEPVFMAAVLLALLITGYLARKEKTLHEYLPCLALGVAVTLAASTRTVGLVVPLVVVAGLLWRRGRRAVPALLVTGVTACALLTLISMSTSARVFDLLPRQYADILAAAAHAPTVDQVSGADPLPAPVVDTADTPPLFWHSLHDYALVNIRSVILPVGGGPVENSAIERLTGVGWGSDAIGAVILALCALGFCVLLMRHRPSVWLLFMVAYLAAIVVWPYSLRRYLYVVQPQLYLTFLVGCTFLLGNLPVKKVRMLRPQAGLAALVAVLVVGGAYASLRDTDSRSHIGDLSQRSAWLTPLSGGHDVLMTEEPDVDAIYSGLDTLAFGPVDDPDALMRYARLWNVSYVLIAPSLQWEPTYSPAYSRPSARLLRTLDSLVEQGEATPVFVSDDGWVRGFYILR
jgi:4-amino-4-deoxy-L-arabinose transferase-like glycosyltransferase